MKRYIFFIMPFLLMGCSDPLPEELDRSIFIPDARYPELPAYSEWGYNTFGAHFNDNVFSYRDYLPIGAWSIKDTLTFVFEGYIKNTSQYEDVTITFALPHFNPTQYLDLVTLNATTFDLTSSSAITTLSESGIPKEGIISSGKLQFKRAQNLNVNGQPDRVILSGYFDFQVVNGNKTFIIKDGRFDIGINENNFYNY